MPMNAPCHWSAFRRERHDERTAIGGAHLARDEAARDQPIEDAGKGRARVRKAAVQIPDRRWGRGREQREDVRLALRQTVFNEGGQRQPDPMRRTMDRWNQP